MKKHPQVDKDFGGHWTHYRWSEVAQAIRGKIHKTMWTNVKVASDRLVDFQRKMEKRR